MADSSYVLRIIIYRGVVQGKANFIITKGPPYRIVLHGTNDGEKYNNNIKIWNESGRLWLGAALDAILVFPLISRLIK